MNEIQQKIETTLHTLTELELRQWYKKGYINTTGYVLAIKRILGMPDSELSIPSVIGFCKEWGISRASFYRAVEELKANGDIERSVKEYGKAESSVRNRLKQKLNGLAEVQTPVGRIDLLTETEIIEVKHVSEWKSAMGQVMAYSGFYPNHQKRIHLFSKKGEIVSPAAIAVCNELDIIVTHEEVEV